MVARSHAWARTVCIAVVLLAAGLAGCLAEVEDRLGGSEEDPGPRVTVEGISSWDSDADLLAFTLEEATADGHPLEDVTVQATFDAGERAELDGTSLCQAPALDGGSCERGVEPSDRWSRGETLYAPCPRDVERVQVTVEGALAADVAGGFDCPARSADGGTDQDQTGDGDSADSGPERASATASGADLDDNGDVEWVKVTLTKGENAPYAFDEVTSSTTAHDGSAGSEVCDTAQGSWNSCSDAFTAGESWDVGENLWIPCKAEGDHFISVSVGGTTILDTTVSCDTNAA